MDRVRPADSASSAARAVVRRYLDEAMAASSRLSDPSDAEALHDCRVALRHLRVAMRAYAPVLKPGVPKGLRRAVTALAAHTGPARDAEVFIEWLAARIRRLPLSSRAGAKWLLGKMTGRREAAYRKLRRLIPKALGMIEPLLRAGLAFRGSASAPTFGQFTAQRVEEQLEELIAALRKIRGPDKQNRAHRARIAAKKLRYLLEPAMTSQGTSILKPLKAVQRSLGEFHDLGGVSSQIERSRRWRVEGPSAGPRRTMDSVQALAERERLSLFRSIERQFLRGPHIWLVPVIRWTARQIARKGAKTRRR